jgi:hypothetical protein
MALRQLLLRFWVTDRDHGDCHFREESLEIVTVVTSKRREILSTTRLVNPVNLVILDLLSLLSRWAGARRAASLSAFRDRIGRKFKNGPIANRSHLILN